MEGHTLLQKAVDKVMTVGLLIILVECVLIITFRDTAATVILGIVIALTVIILLLFIL